MFHLKPQVPSIPATRLQTIISKPANYLILMLPLLILVACTGNIDLQTPLPTPTDTHSTAPSPIPTATRAPILTPYSTATATQAQTRTPVPATAPVPDEWELLQKGLWQRFIPFDLPETEQQAYIYVLRLDPDSIQFNIFWDNETPRNIDEWLAETGALAVFNAGFFSKEHTPVGRIVIDGEQYGFPISRAYGPDSISIPGMFAVLNGEPGIYAIGYTGHNPRGLRYDQMVESYPMLLLPGGYPTFEKETDRYARRTVIAMDEQGYILVILVHDPIFTLHQMANWLAESDLQIDSALNLDGGRSSGLMVSTNGGQVKYPSYVPLPIVIAVYSR